MALNPMLERVRIPKISTIGDTEKALIEFEKSYEKLLFFLENATGARYISANLSANQTANLAAGDHVEFDTTIEDSGHITLGTGTGQTNGIFTLPPGTWMVIASPLRANFSDGTGVVSLRIHDGTTGLGSGPAILRPPSSTSNDGVSVETTALIANTSPLSVELQIQAPTALNNINSVTGIHIFALA